ncbi:unnamed protein product [Anisakis simplex]|uniref:THO complex subunit 5 homolog (inferred by orthology to a human protein) n=1 Tax=Anisakis simplex TaxID=6269 RepID=A0A0M3JRM9_ANISI|nr:unnamed protein product [Anisakis simplex]
MKRTIRPTTDSVQIREKKRATSETSKAVTVSEFYEAEDAEAMRLEWDKVEGMFHEHSNRLRQLCNQLCSDNDNNTNTSEDGMTCVNESIMSHLLSLRRLNRFAQFNNNKCREKGNTERENVDERFLQLQNVQSEIEHLQKEIARCVEFSSADEEIDLVPLNEFYENASAELKEKAQQNAHQERIARLEWELTERKTLIGTLQEREGRKNVLISDISTKQNRLKSLKSMVESLIEAARPVQDLMGLNTLSSDVSQQRQFLAYLPKELFVIFIQVKAYCDLAEDKGIAIRCKGDIENAMKLRENEQEQRSENADEDNDESTDADTDRDRSPSRSRRRHNTLSERMAKRKEFVLGAHPIHLVIDITCASSFFYHDIQISLQFSYILQLHSIAVIAKLQGSSLPFYGNMLCDESILVELYPKDVGDKCPNAVGQAKLDQFHLKVSDYERKFGRMYAFAQRMAGIGRDAEKRSDTQLCDIIESVVKAIRGRVRSRYVLIKSIQSLRSLKLFDDMSVEDRKEYPPKMLSKLVDFKTLSAEEFFSNPIVTNDYREMIESDRNNSDANNHFYFAAEVERSPAKLTALITISVGYPLSDSPLFILSLSIDNKHKYSSKSSLLIKNLEYAINVLLVKRKEAKKRDSLLTSQMAFLVSRLDVLLEVHSQLTDTFTFSRDHLFSRSSRGRDQQPPLNYDPSLNAFTFFPS